MLNKFSSIINDEIDSIKIKQIYKKKQFIFKACETPSGLFILKKGLIALVLNCESGNDHFLRFYKSGDIVSHISLIASEPYHSNAICLEDCEVFFIDKKNFRSLIEKYPQILISLATNISHEICDGDFRRVKMSEKTVTQRTAEAIVYLTEFYPDYKWTRQEIAQYCESTATTIVKVLSKLETKGFINQNGHKIEILNREALLKI